MLSKSSRQKHWYLLRLAKLGRRFFEVSRSSHSPPLIQDERLWAFVLRGDQEKLSFLLAVRRTRANMRSLDKGSELAGDKSADTIRGCSPWRQQRERERKAKWRGGGGEEGGARYGERKKKKENACMCVGEEERQDRTLIRLLVSLACSVGTLQD